MTDESEAIRAIKRLGGSVSRDDTLPGSPVTAVDLGRAKEFADQHVDLLKTLKSLKHLSLHSFQISDAGLLEIGSLGGLTSLKILGSGPGVTEAGVRQLWNLRNLRRLTLGGLWGRNVMDAALQGIGCLQNLAELNLRFAQITDGGLKWIGGLSDLRQLNLKSQRISDAGLQHLKGFTNLTKLDLGWTGITDAGMSGIAELKNLTELDVSWTHIGDSGVAELKRLPNLAAIDLHGTQVTDAALIDLLTFRNLRHLSEYCTRVTSPALKEFRKSRPEIRINWE
jgi:internalin A